MASPICLLGVFEYRTQHHCTQDNDICVPGTACQNWHDASMNSPQHHAIPAMLCSLLTTSDTHNISLASTTWYNVLITSSCFISWVIKEGDGEHLNHSGDEKTTPWRHAQRGESLCCVHRGNGSLPLWSTHRGKSSNGCHHSFFFYVFYYNIGGGSLRVESAYLVSITL